MTRAVKTTNYVGGINSKPEEYVIELEKDLQRLYNKFNTTINFNKVQVGSTNNYAEVGTSGLVTLYGTGQGSLKIRPTMVLTEAGRANVPTEVIRGANVGYSFAVWAAAPPPLPDEELYTRVYVPNRWNGTDDPQVGILVSTSGAEDVGDKFKFQLSWCTTAQGSGTDTVGTTTSDTTSEITIKTGGTAAYSAYDMWFTLDADDANNPIVKGCMLQYRLRRVTATDHEVTAEPVCWDWVTHWRVNKMYGSWAVETNG